MLLEGRSILITGAGSGIGRALAIAFAAKGAQLILVGRQMAPLQETARLLPGTSRAVTISADITNPADRARVVHLCRERGALDILVNNAGVLACGLLDDLDDAILEAMVLTNVAAPISLTRALLPMLRRSDRPRVVNIGSVFGDIGHPYFAGYCATKFALRGFSDAIRRELADDGIGVTYAAPRATDTAAANSFRGLTAAFAMTMDPPDQVATQIVRAVEREARSVYPRGAERAFVALQRLLPQLIDYGLILKSRALRATK